MMNLILFVLAAIGMTNILVQGNIFQPVRDFLAKRLPQKLYQVFECHQCMGTWCGFFCGYILLSHNPFTVFCCGMAGSFLATAASIVLDYLVSKSVLEIRK
jgi:hypothetical protein